MPDFTRQQFLSSVAASALSACASNGVGGRRGPNVLLVILDEWRAQAFGHRGDPNAVTPAIDAFAAQAIDFRQAVAGSPICCPARASLMTGQYPLTHGVYINDVPLRAKGTTLGEAFAEAGYNTGYIGKWHLYGSPQGEYERRLDFIPPEWRYGFHYWKANECTHNYMRSTYYAGDDSTPRVWPGFDAISQTEDARDFIRANAGGPSPYFLVLSWGPPHFPYTPPADYARHWATRAIKLRANVPDNAHAEAIDELRGYYSQMEVLDDCFSHLLSTLEETGGTDDTIVVLLSDHGEMAFSQGIQFKNVPWDEAVRIPLMVRYPRRYGRRGRKIDSPVNMPDVMPTLLNLAGLPIPPAVEGCDWTSSLDGENSSDAPTSALLEVPAPFGSMRGYGIAEFRGLRTARHTYVRSIKGPWLLYDNVDDPYQLENLVDRPEAAELQAALEAELTRRLEERGDAFRPGIEHLRQDRLTHYVEVMMPIGSRRGPDGQWNSTLSESDPNTIPSNPTATDRLHLDRDG